MIIKMVPLLQDSYGEDYDCTLTSLTAVIYNYSNQTTRIPEVYNIVESIAKKYGYDGNKTGTNPLFIRRIFDKSIEQALKIHVKSKCAYLKGVCFNFNTIKCIIDSGNPVILSVLKFGKYKNHTITVIGYEGNDLIVYDNWSRAKTYISYKELSVISSINWVEMKG